MSAKRSSLNPAWKQFSYENMRGRRVGKWHIITHLRNGHWKSWRVDGRKIVYGTVRLDWFGKVLK